MDDLERLPEDHRNGTLTAEILVRSSAHPDADQMQTEILKLDRMIDAEPLGERHTDLCAAFRALMWARSPDSFTAPSECVLP